jgi:hypothetical protein
VISSQGWKTTPTQISGRGMYSVDKSHHAIAQTPMKFRNLPKEIIAVKHQYEKCFSFIFAEHHQASFQQKWEVLD